MLQQILLLLLGFLCASLVALLAAPAVWRRSAELTRKQLEATLPMSRNEMLAVSDRVRAESAMAIRRLEVELKDARIRATEHQAALGRQVEELLQLRELKSRSQEELPELSSSIEQLQAKLAEREGELDSLAHEFAAACDEIERKVVEVEHLWRENEAASLDRSNLQIELVAREARIDQLLDDIQALKLGRRDLEVREHDLSAETKALNDSLVLRERKLASAEKKLARLMADLTSAEERLERRERELERLRAADPGAGDDATQAMIDKLSRERDDLAARLRKVTEENLRLSVAGAAPSPALPAPGDAALRDEIRSLAAEFVHLAALIEGNDSQIIDIVRADRGGNGSIAERVRTLREAAMETARR